MHQAKYVVLATLEDVARVLQALKAWMPARLPEEEGYAIELGIAEVLTNIVKHGYAAHENGSITVSWEKRNSCLEVEILDTGLPIPPQLLAQPNHHAFDFDPDDIARLPENGLGLALARTIFDTVDYESPMV